MASQQHKSAAAEIKQQKLAAVEITASAVQPLEVASLCKYMCQNISFVLGFPSA